MIIHQKQLLLLTTMKTKISIKQQSILKEKEIIAPKAESALNFIRELFPGKFNFTIEEAAKILNISYDFIREHIVHKDIKATKYGDRWMIGLIELARILTEGV